MTHAYMYRHMDMINKDQRAKVNALDSRGGDELKRQIQADVKENDVT